MENGHTLLPSHQYEPFRRLRIERHAGVIAEQPVDPQLRTRGHAAEVIKCEQAHRFDELTPFAIAADGYRFIDPSVLDSSVLNDRRSVRPFFVVRDEMIANKAGVEKIDDEPAPGRECGGDIIENARILVVRLEVAETCEQVHDSIERLGKGGGAHVVVHKIDVDARPMRMFAGDKQQPFGKVHARNAVSALRQCDGMPAPAACQIQYSVAGRRGKHALDQTDHLLRLLRIPV